MQWQRLAGVSWFVPSLLAAWLLAPAAAEAQRTTSREYESERVVDEGRSVVRNRSTAPRSTTRPADAPATRSATTMRSRQTAPAAPELLEERPADAPRTRGAPVDDLVVDPHAGELVGTPEGHLEHDHDAGYFGDSMDCPLCGGDGCELCGNGHWGGLGGIYGRGEYLAWVMRGMNLPPLVTTSPDGTTRPQAGVLGTPGVQVLYGGNSVNDQMMSGARFTLGAWLDDCRRNAMEIDYFALADANDNFSATSTGSPILARPFFNMLTATQTAELVAFPNVITGTVAVDVRTRFQGGGVRMRHVLCCGEDCGPSFLSPVPEAGAYRYEVLLGYRTLQLNDQVSISENLTALSPAGTFLLNDSFQTLNQFHGFDIGMAMQWRRGRWTTDFQSRVAFGNTHATANIRGSTTINNGAGPQTFNGGLLALRSNIGDYSTDYFSVVPEIGITIGYDVTPNIRLLVGYSLVYWSTVARAGDQISLDVNPNLIPPEANPFTGPLRPAFAFQETDFWAYGINAGIDIRF